MIGMECVVRALLAHPPRNEPPKQVIMDAMNAAQAAALRYVHMDEHVLTDKDVAIIMGTVAASVVLRDYDAVRN